jgi:putative ABC transport system substrate-binding protein
VRPAITRLTAIAILALIASSVVAQPVEKIYRIGMLETRPIGLNAVNMEAFRQALLALGYKEGRNLQIAYRSSDGRDERFPGLASELVGLKVDLIVSRGTPASLAAKNATQTIPVVMASVGDPIATKLVASLARPGGNVTGLSALNVGIYAKRVELLRELLPRLTRIAGLFNMGNPVVTLQWQEVQQAARSLGIQPQLLDVRRPEDLPRAFAAAAQERAEALIVALEGLTLGNLRPIAELAAKHRLPSVYAVREYADLGGLMSYGWNDPHQYQRAATFVDKIFKGAKPADLAIEQPTKFELVINSRTAKALGLTIPPSLLLRADQVIE